MRRSNRDLGARGSSHIGDRRSRVTDVAPDARGAGGGGVRSSVAELQRNREEREMQYARARMRWGRKVDASSFGERYLSPWPSTQSRIGVRRLNFVWPYCAYLSVSRIEPRALLETMCIPSEVFARRLRLFGTHRSLSVGATTL